MNTGNEEIVISAENPTVNVDPDLGYQIIVGNIEKDTIIISFPLDAEGPYNLTEKDDDNFSVWAEHPKDTLYRLDLSNSSDGKNHITISKEGDEKLNIIGMFYVKTTDASSKKASVSFDLKNIPRTTFYKSDK